MISSENFINIIGVLFILFGSLQLYPKSRNFLIKWQNEIRGTKTVISKTTITYQIISGIIMIIIGLLVIFEIFT